MIRDDRGCFVPARDLQIPGAWQPCEEEAIGLKEVYHGSLLEDTHNVRWKRILMEFTNP